MASSKTPSNTTRRRSWFPIYPAAMRAVEIERLSDQEFRCLHRLWCYACEHVLIPKSDVELQRIVGKSKKIWNKLRFNVLSMLCESPENPDFYICPMLEEEAAEYAAICEKRRASSQKGGEATKQRWAEKGGHVAGHSVGHSAGHVAYRGKAQDSTVHNNTEQDTLSSARSADSRGEESEESDSSLADKTTTEVDTSAEGCNRLIEVWNDHCVEPLKPVDSTDPETVNDVRRAVRRFKLTPKTFAEVVEKLKTQAFLMGAGEKGWVASFYWLIAKDHIDKVLRGDYFSKDAQQAPRKPVQWVRTDHDEWLSETGPDGIAKWIADGRKEAESMPEPERTQRLEQMDTEERKAAAFFKQHPQTGGRRANA